MPLPELPPFLTRWPDGEVVVTGTRVLLFDIVYYYKEYESAESLGVRFTTVPLATVHKVIAFYLENRATVDEFVAEYQAALDRNYEAGRKLDLNKLRDRLAQKSKAPS